MLEYENAINYQSFLWQAKKNEQTWFCHNQRNEHDIFLFDLMVLKVKEKHKIRKIK